MIVQYSRMYHIAKQDAICPYMVLSVVQYRVAQQLCNSLEHSQGCWEIPRSYQSDLIHPEGTSLISDTNQDINNF